MFSVRAFNFDLELSGELTYKNRYYYLMYSSYYIVDILYVCYVYLTD